MAINRNSAFMERKAPYLVFNTLLPVTRNRSFSYLLLPVYHYTSDFFGSTYDPDHSVVRKSDNFFINSLPTIDDDLSIRC